MSIIKSVSYYTHRVRWHMLVYLSYAHITALAGLVYITTCKWQTIIWALVLGKLSGIGVTGGLHRLWAHRSYRAHWILRIYFMILSSIANQGSIYDWASDHRVHHKFSETEADPHNVRI